MTGRTTLELDTLTIRIPMRLQRRGGRKLIMTPDGVAAPARKPNRDETLVKALVRAHRWRRRIESSQAKSITDLPEQEGVTDAYVYRLLRSPVWRPTLWKRTLMGGCRRGRGWSRCLVQWRSHGMSSESVAALVLWRRRRCDCQYPRFRARRINLEAPEGSDRAASGVDRSDGRVRRRVRMHPPSKARAPRFRRVARTA
jgi:hypothetical protein